MSEDASIDGKWSIYSRANEASVSRYEMTIEIFTLCCAKQTVLASAVADWFRDQKMEMMPLGNAAVEENRNKYDAPDMRKRQSTDIYSMQSYSEEALCYTIYCQWNCAINIGFCTRNNASANRCSLPYNDRLATIEYGDSYAQRRCLQE